jgi:hypothetical protein
MQKGLEIASDFRAAGKNLKRQSPNWLHVALQLS